MLFTHSEKTSSLKDCLNTQHALLELQLQIRNNAKKKRTAIYSINSFTVMYISKHIIDYD